MVTETRTIIFSDADLIEALTPIIRRREKTVPRPQPTDVIQQLGRDHHALVTIKYLEDTLELSFTEDELFTAMMVHCLKLKIPMPRHATKDVESRGDNVALVIRIS